MARGKKPMLFQVGTIDVNGEQKIKTMTTAGVHNTITEMNNSFSKVITLMIKKQVKQVDAFEDGKEG